MKTAISIPDDVFKAVNIYAQEHGCSRSKVFVDAVRVFLKREENSKLLHALNEAYADPLTEEEVNIQKNYNRYFALVLQDEDDDETNPAG